MKLKPKLMSGFLVIVLLAIFMQGIGIQALKKIDKLLNRELLPQVEQLSYDHQVNMLIQLLQYQRLNLYSNLLNYLHTEDAEWKSKYSIDEIKTEHLLEKIASLIKSKDDFFSNMESIGKHLLMQYRRAIEAFEHGEKKEALLIANSMVVKRYDKIMNEQIAAHLEAEHIDYESLTRITWVLESAKSLKKSILKAKEFIRNQMMLAMIGIAVVLAFSILVSLFITRGIVGSITKLNLYIQSLREGDWTTNMPRISGDEIGDFASSFNRLSKELHALSASRQELVRRFEKHRLTQKMLESNQKELEDQKIAAYNLMEDAEEARLISERAASDIKKTAAALANSNRELLESTQLLKAQQQKLVQAEKMSALGTLAAGVAHELNNPLMGILNYVQYAQKKVPANEKVFEVLKDAEKETKRCTRIISNVLTFSRVRSFDTIKALEATFFVKLFDQTLHSLEKRISEEKINIVRDVSLEKIRIKMDESEMEQVLVNLIINAIDAMENKEIREIHVSAVEKGKTLEVKFRDTGTGMDESTISKIFDPFYTTKPTGKGTGLGLSICSTIMQEHGGELLCESVIGQGSIFRLIFPKVF